MNIVDTLLEFRDTQNPELLESGFDIEITNLNVIAIEILSWLKLERKREIWIEQGRKMNLKPMELNKSYPWCNDLVILLQANSVLSDTFCINDFKMEFKDDVPEETIHELRQLAYEKYNPQTII